MTSNLEERIRRRAYEIWEQEGRPEGRDAEHWARAREEIAIQDNIGQTLEPNPIRKTGSRRAKRTEPVEPVDEAVGNRGEPYGPTVQQEGQPAPMPAPEPVRTGAAPPKPKAPTAPAQEPKTPSKPRKSKTGG